MSRPLGWAGTVDAGSMILSANILAHRRTTAPSANFSESLNSLMKTSMGCSVHLSLAWESMPPVLGRSERRTPMVQ
ncbi:hypothetical protein WJX79_007415 [Trebouxia sp. C0005]